MRSERTLTTISFVVCLIAAAGCERRVRTPPKPALDARAAAKQAMAEYDTNQDGKLDKGELKKAPALLAGVKQLDKDGDGAVSLEELVARLQHWSSGQGVLTSAYTEVRLDDQAVADATVTLEPEKFLGATYRPCTGKTDALGHVAFSGSVDSYPGIYFGYYRVRISKVVDGKEKIPAKYNTESELGLEVTDDVAAPRGFMELHLKS